MVQKQAGKVAEADAEREHGGRRGGLQARVRRQPQQFHRSAVRRPGRALQLVQHVQQLGGEGAVAAQQQKLPLGEHVGLGGTDRVPPSSSHPSQPRQLFQRGGDVRGGQPHGRYVGVGGPGGHVHVTGYGIGFGSSRFTGGGNRSCVPVRGTGRASSPVRTTSVHAAPSNGRSSGELYRDDVEQHRLVAIEGEAAQQRVQQPERQLVQHGQHAGLRCWQSRRLASTLRRRWRAVERVPVRLDNRR